MATEVKTDKRRGILIQRRKWFSIFYKHTFFEYGRDNSYYTGDVKSRAFVYLISLIFSFYTNKMVRARQRVDRKNAVMCLLITRMDLQNT